MTDPLPGNGHPQTARLPAGPGVRMGLAKGAALCSAAPLALPCLPQRSPQPGPPVPAGCSWRRGAPRSLLAPWPRQRGPGPAWELSHGREVGSRPTRGDFCSLAGWQLFLWLFGGFYTFVFIFKDCAFIQSSWRALLLAPCASQSTLYAAGWLFWKIALIFLPNKQWLHFISLPPVCSSLACRSMGCQAGPMSSCSCLGCLLGASLQRN